MAHFGNAKVGCSPSMPVYFWNDADGSRHRDAYFEMFPGAWRQGDFFRMNKDGGCFVLGRSDATLPEIPATLTGKKMEVPVRRILMGMPAEKAANLNAMANPRAIDWFVEYARTQRDYTLG
jgi:hypothetical protein